MKIKWSREELPTIASLINAGAVGCLPTDTLYGLVGSALNGNAVSRVYRIKGRDPNKPLIVLFKSPEQLGELGVKVPKALEKGIKALYPAPVTLVLPLSESSPFRSIFKRDDLAVRVPNSPLLLELLELTGPLFAPSANPQGLKPAENCRECLKYFKNAVDFCAEGETGNIASTIVKVLPEGELKLLREGAVEFEKVKEVLLGKEKA
ncbi:L-threonylcarbamoyladenylate synthase [Thermovibrio ammonificans]